VLADRRQKNGTYYNRFRFPGKEYKKSLKTNIDPGAFILRGRTLQQPREAPRKQNLPSTNRVICEYLESRKKFLADTSHSTRVMHLRHLTRQLGERADAPCAGRTIWLDP